MFRHSLLNEVRTYDQRCSATARALYTLLASLHAKLYLFNVIALMCCRLQMPHAVMEMNVPVGTSVTQGCALARPSPAIPHQHARSTCATEHLAAHFKILQMAQLATLATDKATAHFPAAGAESVWSTLQ